HDRDTRVCGRGTVRVRRPALIIAVAVLGIAVAAGITYGTDQLVRQRIGLVSEPLTAGQRLFPRGPVAAHERSTVTRGTADETPSTAAKPPAPSATTRGAAGRPPVERAAQAGSAPSSGSRSSGG